MFYGEVHLIIIFIIIIILLLLVITSGWTKASPPSGRATGGGGLPGLPPGFGSTSGPGCELALAVVVSNRGIVNSALGVQRSAACFALGFPSP